MKLKDIRKGDVIILFKHTSGHKKELPYQVTYISFYDEMVWDVQLANNTGHEKHYSFIDWNKEVKTGEMPDGVCPYCGR